MHIIDLRSDTVTHPTENMRRAMANAPVGDDVYEEDPTINSLQDKAAAKMGMEAGLFVASGTMGNLLAVLAHCGRGDEAIMGSLGHTFLHEAGGISALGGVHSCQIPNQPNGTLAIDDLAAAVRSEDVHHPISRLIILENTQNSCGGVPLTADYTAQVARLAHQNDMLLHVDGARIFNAAIALGVEVKDLVSEAESITFCLSKGLCAPVGSVLCGSKSFIRKARHIRKQVGGGMRQAGILAAAGIIALDEMVDRLGDDHRRAKVLAEGIQNIPGLQLDGGLPTTNMVYFSIDPSTNWTAPKMSQILMEHGIRIQVVSEHRVRLVTHAWIEDEDIDKVIQEIKNM